MKTLCKFLFFTLVMNVWSLSASTSWTGSSSTSWSDAGNWTAGIPTSTVDAIIGDTNFTGLNQPALVANASCKSLTLGSGTKSSTLTVAKALTVSGDITIGAKGTISHTVAAVISLIGNWSNSGTYTSTKTGSTVTFAGVTQLLGGTVVTPFRKLTINASSTTKLQANATISNQLTVNGVLDPDEPSTYAVTGAGKFVVNAGGKALVKGATFSANYGLSGTTTLAGTSIIDYGATNINQTVSSSLSYGTLRISGSGTKTLAGNLTALNSTAAGAGNVFVAAGTLDLAGFTANRGTSIAGGTFTVANGATLKISGTATFPANYASHFLETISTVEYGGGNQTVSAETYGNLVLGSSSGAVVKTMPGTALTIAGSLTATKGTGTSLSFTAGAGMTVYGSISLGAAVVFNGGSFTHSLGANWANSGTFTGSSSTLTIDGANAVLSGTGTNNFFNLVVTRTGVTAATNMAIAVTGDLTATGVGYLTHIPGGTGTITMAGSGKSISGPFIFNNLTITGSVSPTTSFTVAGNLQCSGSLASSAGVMSFTGTGKTISGTGSIALSGVDVAGSITTTNNISVAGDFSVSAAGSFSATSGTVTFTGTTALSGIANFSNVALNGTRLQLSTDSNLGISGSLTLTSGAFDTTTNDRNTVTYNGSGAQSITSTTYNILTLSGSATKTAAGALTIGRSITISAGTTFNAGSSTHTIYRNWFNNGTFVPATSTVQFVGPIDSAINGITTFNTLALNKSSSAIALTMTNNITAATLNIVTGLVQTGTNSVTVTSSRLGSGTLLGTIVRTHSFTTGVGYAFESPDNTLTFSSLSGVTSVSVTIRSGAIVDFPFGSAINREYTVSVNGGSSYNATWRLHYEDSELNGNNESSMQLWRYNSAWAVSGKTSNNSSSNWVEQSGITNLVTRWTLSDNANVVRWNGTMSSAWETAANWTTVQGAPALPPSSNDVVELGTAAFSNQPTIASAATIKSISFGSAQSVALTIGGGGSLSTEGNIRGNWTNAATHSIAIGAQSLRVGGDLALSDGTNNHNINVTISTGSLSVTNDLTLSGNSSLVFSSNGQLELGANFVYSGATFVPGSSTVIYSGGNAQTVAPVSYADLTFKKSAGVATLSLPCSVGGNLLVTNSGILLHTVLISVSSNVTVSAGAGLVSQSVNAKINVGGNWNCGGTFDSGPGEVSFNGTGSQSIGGTTFSGLKIDKASGVATLTGNVLVNGNLTVSNGVFDLGSFYANRSAVGGLLTLSPNVTLKTATNFPANFAARSLAASSTVEYNGVTRQSISAESYGYLIFSNGGTNAKTLGGATTVQANLLINSNSTFNGSSYLIALSGNWTNNGTFQPANSTLRLDGNGKFLSGNTTYSNLTVVGSYVVPGNDIYITGNLTIQGSFDFGGGSSTLDGDLLNAGSLSSSGISTFSGTRVQTIQLLGAILTTSTGVINFNGTVAPVLNSTTPPQYVNVNINNTAGITPSIGWTVYGAFTVATNATFNGGSLTHTFYGIYGSFTNKGTITSSGILDFRPISPMNVVLRGTSFNSTGTVRLGGTGLITLSGATPVLNSLVIANTHASGINAHTNLTLSGELVIASGSTFNAGSGFTHTLADDISNDGVFAGQSSTVVLNGTSQILGNGATTFNHLLVNGTATAIADCDISGSFTNNGSFDATGALIRFTGGSSSLITGSVLPLFDVLGIAKSGNSVSLGVTLTNLSQVTVSSGVFDLGSFTLVQTADAGGGSLAVSANGTLKIGGTNSLPAFTTLTLDPASTVEYAGGATQTVAAQNYGNLSSTGAGARVLSSSGTIGVASVFTPGSNSYTNTGSTVEFNGSSTQTIPAFSYNHLTSSSSGTRVLASSGSINIAGTFTPGSHTYSVTNSTVNFNGAAQTIPAFTFNNLTVSGSGTKTVGGNIIANGALNLATGTLADGGFSVTVNGDVSNSATHSGTGKILLASGSGKHLLSGTGSYSNLELNDSYGATLNLVDLTVNGTLTLTAGKLTSVTNKVVMATNATLNRVAGYVVGSLQKSVASGPNISRTFEIGTTNGYNPVSLTFSNVTVTGNLTAVATAGDHPSISSSTLKPSYSANVYWSLSKNPALAFNAYNATFNFNNPTDLDFGINPLLFKGGNYVSSAWNYPQLGTRTSTNTQVIAVSTLGEFALGGNVNSAPTLSAISNVAINEDASLQTVNLGGISAGPADENSQILTISASSSDEALIPSPVVNYTNGSTTGNLTFTPIGNGIGTCIITVVVQDNGGTLGGGIDSVTNSFSVTVNAVNHAPSFTQGLNVFVPTNASPQTITNWATQISPGEPANEAGQAVNFIVSNDSTNLFAVQPTVSADGTLTFTPVGTRGLALVSVQLHDNGGTNNGGQNVSSVSFFGIGIGVGGFTPATGGEAISADDALVQTNWTTLTGPNYYEGTNGDIGVGNIILTAPAGFEFDTNIVSGKVVGVLITAIASAGTNSANINGVTNGAFIPLVVTRSNVSFTITSPSTNGAVDYVELKNLRVRPTDTNLITGTLLDTGTIGTNYNFGTLTEVAGAAAKLGIQTQPSSTASAGIDFAQQPVIRIEDQFGHLVTNDNTSQVFATRLSGNGSLNGVTSVTALEGLVTFANLAHHVATNISINFTCGSLTNVVSSSIAVAPAEAYQLVVQAQPSTSATAGVSLVSQPIIRIEDSFGNLVTTDNSTAVTASRVGGSGTLQGTTTVTASGGLVTFANLSHNVATTIALNFTSGSLIDATSGSITVTAAAPYQLKIQTQPSPNAMAGVSFAVQPAVRIEDAFGNLITNSTSLVTATRLGGSGTLQGTTAIAASGGIVTFGTLSHNVATNITVRFASSDLIDAISDPVVVSPALAYRLAMQTQPSSSAIAGASFPVQPVIRIEDALGNLVSSDKSTLVTATRLAGSGTLQGTTIAAASGGLVTFSNLSHDVATTITIDFTSGSLSHVTSDSIAISAGSIAQLTFTQEPASTIAGKVFATQPRVGALDQFGNPTTTLPANLNVTIALTSGSGLLLGQKIFDIGTAAGNGVVTFTNLELNAAGNKQLTASGTGLTNAVSGVFANIGTLQRYESAGDFSVGQSPRGICLGNFRGTGDFRDMAVPNYSDNTVTVRNCNDDGTFGAVSAFSTGLNPIASGFSDLDRDHLDDFVVANYGTNTVSVFINERPGFANGVAYPVGPGNPGPIDLAFSDWNGDGRPDVFVANALSNNVSVLLGLGSGALGPFTNYSVGAHPSSIAVVDMNGDGIQDILTANTADNTLSILHGNSAHTFDAAQTISVFPGGNPQPKKAIATDVNHDGLQDIITVNYGSNNISVFLGQANGTFNWSTNYEVGTRPVTVWPRDLDNDGLIDLVVVNSGSATVDFLFNQANGSYVSGGNFPVGAGPVAISESNFNGDRVTDLAVVNADANTVSVLLYSGPVGASLTTNVLEDVATPLQLSGRSLHPTTFSYSITQQPTNGVLTIVGDGSVIYTPNSNFYGVDAIKYTVTDGLITSPVATVILNVLPVNDAPTFTLSASDLYLVGNAGLQTNVNFVTAISPGPNESSQTVNFVVSSAVPSFFSSQPRIGSGGTLTFATATGVVGTNTVTVRLTDNGGVVRGTNQSSPQTFRIIATNIPPVITVQPSIVSVIQGNNASFQTTASGTPPFSYQWRKNGTPISGGTDRILSLVNVQAIGTNFYDCTVSNAGGSVATITNALHGRLIVLADTNRPTVAFAYPVANVRYTNQASYSYGSVTRMAPSSVISGTATDNGLITNVTITRIFPAYPVVVMNPTLYGLPGAKKWTNEVTLAGGTNIWKAVVQDSAGNSNSVLITRSCFFAASASLTIITNGSGSTAPVGTATSFVSFGQPTNGALLEVGRQYTILATAGANNIFTNWTVTDDLTTNVFSTNKLTFTMVTNLVISGNFVTNPIIAAGVAGKYNGLFYETNGVSEPSIKTNSTGFIGNLVVSTNRTYSGSLTLESRVYTIAGTFDLSGDSTKVVSRALYSRSNLFLTLHLDWALGTKTVTGSISNMSSISREQWSAPLLADLAGTDATLGVSSRYTMLIGPGSNSPTNSPAGYGYGLVTNTPLGLIILSGKLADGTAISQSVPKSKDGYWPLFVSLYGGRDLVAGWQSLSSGAPSGTVGWVKGTMPSSSPINSYLNGFTNASIDVTGSVYVKPALNTPSLANTNLVLEINSLDTNGVRDLKWDVQLKPNNTFVVKPGTIGSTSATNVLTGSIGVADGVLTFSFRPTGLSVNRTIMGAVDQSQTNGFGANIGRSLVNTSVTNVSSFYLHVP